MLALAQQLRKDGIAVELDQFHQQEPVHWSRWCEEQLRPENSDFVLCVCTEEYKRRVEGRVAADVGKGVYWEGTLVYNYLYYANNNSRFVPVGLTDPLSAPLILAGYTRFHLSVLGLASQGSEYENLYRLLTRQPATLKASIGEIYRLAALTEKPRLTDFGPLLASVKADTQEILSILKTRPPPPSTAARPHNLPPWMAPEFFIGRGAELKMLCDGMETAGAFAVVQPQVVRGTGGIGKTRLALQALWVLFLQCKCDMAFSISAASASELDAQLAALSEKSLLDVYGAVDPPRDLQQRRNDAVRSLREKSGRWIILLDAADSIEARDLVNRLLRELAGGRFLITSRRDNWPKGTVRQVPLRLFSPEEALDCLRSRYWKASPSAQELEDFNKVADELGYLPLALTLAASYMENRRITPARYLLAWLEQNQTLINIASDDPEYGRSLMAAFQLSFNELSERAMQLLGMFAWFAPEPFPRELVENSDVFRDTFAAQSGGEDTVDIGAVLGELKTLSLIDLTDSNLELHKLTLACARSNISAEARGGALNVAVGWIRNRLPASEFDVEGWNLWRRLTPHIEAVVETSEMFAGANPSLAGVCNAFGLWQFRQARYVQAEPLMRRALVIDEKSYGTEHPEVATDLNNLGQLLQATNRLGEAEPLMRRALAIDEKSYGTEHPNVARGLNNLAQLLQATDRQWEAEPLMRRGLGILLQFTVLTGHRHPNLAGGLGNYLLFLQEMSLTPEQIGQKLAEAAHEAKVAPEVVSKLIEEIAAAAEIKS